MYKLSKVQRKPYRMRFGFYLLVKQENLELKLKDYVNAMRLEYHKNML